MKIVKAGTSEGLPLPEKMEKLLNNSEQSSQPSVSVIIPLYNNSEIKIINLMAMKLRKELIIKQTEEVN